MFFCFDDCSRTMESFTTIGKFKQSTGIQEFKVGNTRQHGVFPQHKELSLHVHLLYKGSVIPFCNKKLVQPSPIIKVKNKNSKPSYA